MHHLVLNLATDMSEHGWFWSIYTSLFTDKTILLWVVMAGFASLEL